MFSCSRIITPIPYPRPYLRPRAGVSWPIYHCDSDRGKLYQPNFLCQPKPRPSEQHFHALADYPENEEPVKSCSGNTIFCDVTRRVPRHLKALLPSRSPLTLLTDMLNIDNVNCVWYPFCTTNREPRTATYDTRRLQCDTAGKVVIGPPNGADYSFGMPPGTLDVSNPDGIKFELVSATVGGWWEKRWVKR